MIWQEHGLDGSRTPFESLLASPSADEDAEVATWTRGFRVAAST